MRGYLEGSDAGNKRERVGGRLDRLVAAPETIVARGRSHARDIFDIPCQALCETISWLGN